ncbi:MAG: diaminopimelate decarboxylase [Lachnospiraceae bacterium]|nr:diaminopimelate decarboxylase [Lachnospiraceae bacterium]
MKDIVTLVQEDMFNIKTPSYIFDISFIEEHLCSMRRQLKDIGICYAIKANPFLVGDIHNIVDRLEVCSPGEYEICISKAVESEKIIVSGVNKTYESINRILQYSQGKGIYTIESRKHVDILSRCAKENSMVLDVIIRLTSGNQFGVSKNECESIIDRILNCNSLKLKGIHYYSGTQKKLPKIEKELKELDEYVAELKRDFNIDEMELEYGPGMLVSYFEDNDVVDDIEQIKCLNEYASKLKHFDKVTFEFGRFIAAKCGYYVTRINDIKKTDKTNYIIVDGGIHQVNYYGQIMGMKKPYLTHIRCNKKDIINNININSDIVSNINIQNESNNSIDSNSDNIINSKGDKNIDSKRDNNTKWTICGSLCTVNDVLVREKYVDNPCIDDIIIFENVGAYSVTEGMSRFLSRELPSIYMSKDNRIECIREQEETYRFNM